MAYRAVLLLQRSQGPILSLRDSAQVLAPQARRGGHRREHNGVALGIDLPDMEPHLLYAHRMEAIFWWPQPLYLLQPSFFRYSSPSRPSMTSLGFPAFSG